MRGGRLGRLGFAALLSAATALAGCASAEPRGGRPSSSTRETRRVISTPNAPAALAAYSQGLLVGDTLYIAGQIGLDPATRELVPGGIGPETRRALENCRAVLEAAGFTLADVVQSQVFLADIEDFAAMNEVYVTFFPKDPPPRAALAVGALPRGARVEVVLTARR